MSFEPIAIVGQSCILPDALTPAALWQNVVTGRCSLRSTPEGRWGAPFGDVVTDPSAPVTNRTWCTTGGYVDGFDAVFDPHGFALPAAEIAGLDPLFHWVLHGAREALRFAKADASNARTGLVLGNLSFPSTEMSRYAASVWLDRATSPETRRLCGLGDVDARNRFTSGLPALLAARALALGGSSFALDAACASSLYAIKLACDQLQDGRADRMIAGAVNRADDLFIHIGFCSLAAMSKQGLSRPFHRDADGLVPAEGAAFVVLERLSDALRAKRKILAVIRGIGLSNDGRGHGTLVAPAREGQERALRAAYASADLLPRDISYVECHATGTKVGDATELAALSAVFADCKDVCIGSLKANLGHLITAAGAGAVLKVISAMEAEIKPPTPSVDVPMAELSGSPFRVLSSPEPWRSTGTRRAAVSAFGFGGNNAHLLLEQYGKGNRVVAAAPPRRQAPPIAIVGMAVKTAKSETAAEFFGSWCAQTPEREPREHIALDTDGLKFPPTSLARALPQQLLVFEAAREAARTTRLPRNRTQVVIGMGCDTEIARYWAGWCSNEWARKAALLDLAEVFTDVGDAPTVIGTMPNIVANRINCQLDLGGASYALSAEEHSGLVALQNAARALSHQEIDAAVVGAVDVSHEPAHQSALRAIGHERPAGDAAVVLILKRQADAERDGDRVLALLGDGRDAPPESRSATRLATLFGHAHAAVSLLDLAGAALELAHGARVTERGALPALGLEAIAVESVAFAAPPIRQVLRSPPRKIPLRLGAPPRLHVFAGTDREGALAAARAKRTSNIGNARLVLVAGSDSELETRIAAAEHWLNKGGPVPEGVAFCARPIAGETAFVFTGAAAAYPGMGKDLVLAAPSLERRLAERGARLDEAMTWVYGDRPSPGHPLNQLWACSFLCQLHVELTTTVLGLRPHATIGYSSGESNALFGLGAWSDLDAMTSELKASSVFSRQLTGELNVLKSAWSKLGVEGTPAWRSVAISATPAKVRECLQREPCAHLLIINAPDECVIGGDPGAVARLVERLGNARAVPIDYELVAHCPEVELCRNAFYDLHLRDTKRVDDVRFYSTADATWYHPTPERAALAITAQAVGTVDFPAVIERAYADGVRIFVEHGPRALCSGWVTRILGEREHLAISFDVHGRSSLRQAAHATAWLAAAGLPVNADAFNTMFASETEKPRALLRLPAHSPPIRSCKRSSGQATEPVVMPPAPPLPPILDATATVVSSVAPTVASPSAHRAPCGLAAAMASHHAVISAMHKDFVARQATVEQQFLATRAAAQRLLFDRWSASQQRGEISPTASTPIVHKRPGPKFDRAALEELASGKISRLFGSAFAGQDAFVRQVRMPCPPLLLADRVTGIDAVPGSMELGTIWTETDVTAQSWYLHHGHMPASIMIESGQADLLLISWLGVDRLNRGERVYRLLGCEASWHGGLPKPGDTLAYDIHVDGHATQDGVRLFFFHYDCRINGEVRLSVRNGQAGFFTDAELKSSGGILWSPEDTQLGDRERVFCPPTVTKKRGFTSAEVHAFAEGRLVDCFGEGFERTEAHTRTPTVQSDRMLFLGEVTHFDPAGGPWKNGYLRAEAAVSADDWYFAGHFKNDPCMPGTLVFEGCLQAMAFYMAALGLTLHNDGWRFEPAPDEKFVMRCRGQITPASRLLVYEVFVRELVVGPQPVLYADLLCTVDGRKAFHARRAGLRLVPDWPLEPAMLPECSMTRVASNGGVSFDERALMACAIGRPSAALGESYRVFDGVRRAPRLPGPPYHFMSRVTRIEAEADSMRSGGTIEVEYDVPKDAWYFDHNDAPVMPFCVLMEVGLQGCGWLASYLGCALSSEEDLLFRNLDGTATVLADVPRDADVVRTQVRNKSLSRTRDVTVLAFEVVCFVGEQAVLRMDTAFGFFPRRAFENQAGLAMTDVERARLLAPGETFVDLSSRPARYFNEHLRLPGPMLCLLDRVVAFERAGGARKLGYVRAEKGVDPRAWYFKAHFFQDPVQPGSLGVQALLQLLSFYAIDTELGRDVPNARFETAVLGRGMIWKYRGQVVPENECISLEIEIVERGRDARGPFAIADGWLAVDGKRVYLVQGLCVRVVSDATRVASKSTQPGLDLSPISAYWDKRFGLNDWCVQDLFRGLMRRFVSEVVFSHPSARATASARPCLYLANHQVGVESLLFAPLCSALTQRDTVTLAKAEHRGSWIGLLAQHCFSYPGLHDATPLVFFDRQDRASLLRIVSELAVTLKQKNVLVHAEGTRALACRKPVTTLSAVFIDLALSAEVPIVPVRFLGGLPVDPLAKRIEFPFALGRQAYWIGAPIMPETLRPLGLKDRTALVLDAMNTLGPPLMEEVPIAAVDHDFADRIAARVAQGARETSAILVETLLEARDAGGEFLRLQQALASGRRIEGTTPLDTWLQALCDLVQNGPG